MIQISLPDAAIITVFSSAFAAGVAWMGVKGKISSLTRRTEHLENQIEVMQGPDGARLLRDCIPYRQSVEDFKKEVSSQYGQILEGIAFIKGRLAQMDQNGIKARHQK